MFRIGKCEHSFGCSCMDHKHNLDLKACENLCSSDYSTILYVLYMYSCIREMQDRTTSVGSLSFFLEQSDLSFPQTF